MTGQHPQNEKARLGSFTEFWPFYLSEHRHPRGRFLHYIGTVLSALILLVVVITGAWLWLPLVLVAGYGPAWAAHFLIEKNRPATFQYPLWSLRGDYRMFGLAITGRLDDEIDRLSGRNQDGVSERAGPERGAGD